MAYAVSFMEVNLARRTKIGIEYFSHDVDSISDKKLRLLKAKHGVIGYGIYFLLLEEIYREGYYITTSEEFNILFVSEHNLDQNVYIECLNDCIKFGLFDKEIYEECCILTSKRIQENYLEACSRRKLVEVDDSILLVNADILTDNVDISTKKKRKEKKGDEKKRNEMKYLYTDAFEHFWNNSTKKGAKRNAFNEFKKVIDKVVTLDVLVSAYKKQIENDHFKGSDGKQYVLHVERWLKNSRWEDHVETLNKNRDPF